MIQISAPIIKFKPEASSTIQTIIKAQQWLQKYINTDDEWDVATERSQIIEDLNLVHSAQQINIKSLKIRWTQKPTILKSIKSLYLPFLKQLFLNGNNIQSIQLLTGINAPYLQSLNLKQNFITTISPLKKFLNSSLISIDLYKNKIYDLEGISEANCPNLEYLWVNAKMQIGNNPDSVTWICKISSASLKKCFIHQDRAIQAHQKLISEKISAKHQKQIQTRYLMRDDSHIQWL